MKDTGAEVSVLPAIPSQRTLPPVTSLYAVDSFNILVYKRLTLKVELFLRRAFEWTFYVAGVSQPVSGFYK